MLFKQLLLKFNTPLDNGDEFRRCGFIYDPSKEIKILFNNKEAGVLLKIAIEDLKLYAYFETSIDMENEKLYLCPNFNIKISYNKRKKTWSDCDLRGGKEFKKKEPTKSFVFLLYDIDSLVMSAVQSLIVF